VNVAPRRLLADYAPILVAAALLALVPLRYSDSGYMMGVVTEGVVFACYAVAFNVIFGSTGQLFLCVGALAGIGGFTSAIFADRVGLPMLLAIGAATAGAAVIGGLLSWIAVKRGLGTIFIGVVTLAASLSYESLVNGLRDLTGGENGLVVEAGDDTFLREDVPPYYLFLGLLVVFLVVFRVLQRSRLGWAFRALRDDPVAAELSGVDVGRYKVYAGMIGSAMLGLTGAIVAHGGRGRIGTHTYGFSEIDVPVLVMLALGGIGFLLGPVLGAAAVTWLDEFLVDYQELRMVIYGIVLIVLFIGLRRGVGPTVVDAITRRRRTRERPAEPADATSRAAG
jgi:branched-chain amino acid transport system permease protein